MLSIPPTSPERYLTGFEALNIPLADGTAADWRFHEVFVACEGPAHVAGAGYPPTSVFFGGYGIRECGDQLRKMGRADVLGPVWAADHVRAILDLVAKSVMERRLPDHVPADDLLDREADRAELRRKVAEFRAKVSDDVRNLIDRWGTKCLAA